MRAIIIFFLEFPGKFNLIWKGTNGDCVQILISELHTYTFVVLGICSENCVVRLSQIFYLFYVFLGINLKEDTCVQQICRAVKTSCFV